MRLLLVVALASCSAPPRPQTISNLSDHPARPSAFTVRMSGVGPLGDRSEATLEGLRAAMPGLEVKLNDLGGDSGIVFDVFDGGEKLLYVVPDEEEQEENGTRRYGNTIFTIFVTSPRIAVDGYSWRVGSPLESAKDLTRCECWGSGEVTACSLFAYLAVIFEERCEAAEQSGPQAMVGHKIGRIMWERVSRD